MLRLLLTGFLMLIALTASAGAGQDDPRLTPLFERLKATLPDDEARAVERQIWDIWTTHRDPEIQDLMRGGIVALAENDASTALDAFSEVIRRDKDFAEGWNKRATVEYVTGTYTASIADVERTLALEPRHFGALSGLGLIYLAMDRKREALKAFRQALAVDPNLSGLKERVEALEKELEGQPI
jgi:tetratricopeptide (TPR) repeat protein